MYIFGVELTSLEDSTSGRSGSRSYRVEGLGPELKDWALGFKVS